MRRARSSRWLRDVVMMISGAAALLAGLWLSHQAQRATADPYSAEAGRGEPTQAPDARAIALGYEPVDMNAPTMAWLVLGLAGAVAIAIGLMFLMLHVFRAERLARQAPLTTQQEQPIAPPNPRLQADPQEGLLAFDAHEQAVLHSYAWIDAKHTVARIPIERAMALSVGHSLDGSP